MALPDTTAGSIIATRRWYQRMIEMYLDECFEGRTAARASELAYLLGANRCTVSREVLNLFGKTLGQILQERQFEYALRLLTTTPLPAREVGRAAAFGDVSTFFRSFRQHFGMTPNEYRAKATKCK